MSKVLQPIIDQGVVRYNGEFFTYRSFLTDPIGRAHLFPENKPSQFVVLEMEVLNAKDKADTINVLGSGNHKVWWDDEGIAHVAAGELDIYDAMKRGEVEVISINPDLFHEYLLKIYNRFR